MPVHLWSGWLIRWRSGGFQCLGGSRMLSRFRVVGWLMERGMRRWRSDWRRGSRKEMRAPLTEQHGFWGWSAPRTMRTDRGPERRMGQQRAQRGGMRPQGNRLEAEAQRN